MCQSHDALLKASRHRFERPLFALAAALTVCTFLCVLGVSLFRDDVLALVKQQAVAEYTAEHPESKTLPEAEIIKKLPEEERDTIKTIEDLNPALVMLAPTAFTL